MGDPPCQKADGLQALGAEELGLQGLLLGKVAHQGAEYLFALIGDDLGAEPDIDEGTILSPVLAIKGERSLCLEELLKPPVDSLAVGGDEIINRESSDLLRGITQQFLEGNIGFQDTTGLHIHEKDTIRGLLHNRPVAPLALPQGLLPSRALDDA